VDETGIANPGWLAQGASGSNACRSARCVQSRAPPSLFGCGLQTVSPDPAKGYGG